MSARAGAGSGGGEGAPVPVTVVIPFYQGHDTISRALRSLGGQTRPPAEIVIIDDASPAPLDPRDVRSTVPVRVIRHPSNKGIPGARNTGIRAAATDWVAFLDQDDEWAPDKLERQWAVARASHEPTGVAVFGRLHIDFVDRPSEIRPPARAMAALEAGGDAALEVFLRHGNALPLITLLLPRGVFERYGYLDESLRGGADDTELVLRLIAEGVPFRAARCGAGWCARHHVTGSNYSDDVTRWVGDQLTFLPRLAERYPAMAALEDRFLARSHFVLGRHHEKAGDRRRAAQEYRRARSLDRRWWKPAVARPLLALPVGVRRAVEGVWRRLRG